MGDNLFLWCFFKPLLTELGWTRATTSGAYSLFMLLHGALYIITGRLNDKYGPRIVIIVCSLFLGLGYLLMSQVNTIWQLYLFYGVLVGIGMTGNVPLLSTISRWFVKRRGLMTGIALSSVGIGTMIMPPLLTWLISTNGWRNSYIIVGIIVLVLVILAAQFLRRDPSQMGQLPDGANEVTIESSNLEAGGFSLQEAIHTKHFWMLGAMFFCGAFCLQSIMVHITPHATDLRISAASAASILAIIGGLSIVGRIIIGSAGDRMGSKTAFIITFVMMSVSLFWLVTAKEIRALCLFAVVFGIAYGGFIVLFSPSVAELFGLNSHGVILGIITFVGTIGGAIGPVLAGGIFDATDSYTLAFVGCGIISTIGLILTLLLRSTVTEVRK